MKFDLTISIVLYKSDKGKLLALYDCISRCLLKYKLILVDNSPSDDLKHSIPADAEYIFMNQNAGFGKAHNVALRKALDQSKYHLVLNPDVTFPENTLEQLYDYMESNPDVGLVLPKVLNFDSEIQYVSKRLPRPVDLIIRRLNSSFLTTLFRAQLDWYEMREKDYETSFEAPSLSGCFLYLRVAALEKVGFFDERYFMYMEDIDLSRRMFAQYRNVYYPRVHIFHGHAQESYKTWRLLKVHAASAIRYFNKWGWIFDFERKKTNRSV